LYSYYSRLYEFLVGRILVSNITSIVQDSNKIWFDDDDKFRAVVSSDDYPALIKYFLTVITKTTKIYLPKHISGDAQLKGRSLDRHFPLR